MYAARAHWRGSNNDDGDDDVHDVTSCAPTDSAHAYHNRNYYTHLTQHGCYSAAAVVLVRYKRYAAVWALCSCASATAALVGHYVVVCGDRGWHCGLVTRCGVLDDTARCCTRAANSSLLSSSLLPSSSQMTLRADVNAADTKPSSSLQQQRQQLRSCGDCDVPQQRVQRALTAAEEDALAADMLARERVALRIAIDLVRCLRLPMTVVDCEYQWDGRRITFFYYHYHHHHHHVVRTSANTHTRTRAQPPCAAVSPSREFVINYRPLTRELFRVFAARIWLECLGKCDSADEDEDDEDEDEDDAAAAGGGVGDVHKDDAARSCTV